MTTEHQRRSMTHRERVEAVLAGRSPDRIPWLPRPELWYSAKVHSDTMPAKFEGFSLDEVRQALGMGTWAKGDTFRTEVHDVEVRQYRDGMEDVTEWITPVGALTERHRHSEKLHALGIQGQVVEKVLKRREDYAVLEYIVERTEIIPTYEAFLAGDEAIGERGFTIAAGPMDPVSDLMLTYVGYNDVYYHLHDYPREVESLCERLEALAEKKKQVLLDSPASLVMSGTHFSSMMTPPKVFREMMPFYQSFSERLHARGKKLACHADGDTSLLLELLVEAGYDLMDSYVTAPMVPVTLERARQVFGDRVVIWGGLPSTLLCEPVSDEEFEEYMMHLFRTIAPGDAFILAVADNIMPETKLERLERVAEMIEEFGRYPIRV